MTIRTLLIEQAISQYPEALAAYHAVLRLRGGNSGPRSIGRADALAAAEAEFSYQVDRVIHARGQYA